MPSKEEQETTVTWAAGDSFVYVYTSVPKHLRRMRADKRFTETKGEEDWGNFFGPRGLLDPLTGIKRTRKAMTPEQKAASVARLAAARDRKGVTNGDT